MIEGSWNVLPSRIRFLTADVVVMISRAAIRPPPILGTKVWAMTPWSDSDSCVRIWDCWWGGKTSMIRSTVWAADEVCSVPKTRWPVSAAETASEIVSRSRISPTRMTSGSSRRAARRAEAKDSVWTFTSRWLTRHFLCGWTNSIGSSTVRMWAARSLLIRSTMAARVVDLPEPVGPVTRTSPRSSRAISARMGGKPRSANDLISFGMTRKTAPSPRRPTKKFTRNLARFGISMLKSRSRLPSNAFCWSPVRRPIIIIRRMSRVNSG